MVIIGDLASRDEPEIAGEDPQVVAGMERGLLSSESQQLAAVGDRWLVLAADEVAWTLAFGFVQANMQDTW
jgi:hypothetical protein